MDLETSLPSVLDSGGAAWLSPPCWCGRPPALLPLPGASVSLPSAPSSSKLPEDNTWQAIQGHPKGTVIHTCKSGGNVGPWGRPSGKTTAREAEPHSGARACWERELEKEVGGRRGVRRRSPGAGRLGTREGTVRPRVHPKVQAQ